MTNEIAQKFLKHNDLKVLAGRNGIRDLFYPFLLMDASYQLFAKDVRPIPCKTEMKRCRNQLSKAYNSYWKRFFMAFNIDEADEVTTMMDKYSEFINNQVLQLKVAAMNVIIRYIPDFNAQQVLASCFASCTLSDCASVVHELIFKNRFGEPSKDTDIAAVLKLTKEYSDWYMERYTSCRDCIPVGSDPQVIKVVDVLIHRIARFNQ